MHERLAGESACPTLRLGLRYARGLREEAARVLLRARAVRPFTSVDDLAVRVRDLRQDELNRLAEIGALNTLEKQHRRDTLPLFDRHGRSAAPKRDRNKDRPTTRYLRGLSSPPRAPMSDHPTTLRPISPALPVQFAHKGLSIRPCVARARPLPKRAWKIR